ALPFLFIYVGIEIFRAENNRIPFLFKLATFFFVAWLAGLFGLVIDSTSQTSGGFVGRSLNSAMTAIVTEGVGVFIYVLLLVITSQFMFRLSPLPVMSRLWELIRRDSSEEESNVVVMRKAAAADKEFTPVADLKLNAGVPMVDGHDDRKESRLSSLK